MVSLLSMSNFISQALNTSNSRYKFRQCFQKFASLQTFTFLCMILLLLTLGGCAQTGKVKDPLEPANRKIASFNDTVDRWALKPIAEGYVSITPEPIRNGISNFFDNLLYPTVIVNQFLQGKFKTGSQDAGRFLINSTIGVAGFVDIASHMGFERHEEDFGQTFAVWGFSRGPYLVLPLLGPSTVSDGIGKAAGLYTYPPTYIEDDTTRLGVFGLRMIDTRASLLETEKLISGDRYLFVRDAYLQRREYLIRDGETKATDPFLDD